MSGVNMDSSYRQMIDDAGKQVTSATTAGQSLIDKYNDGAFKDAQGKKIGPYDTLAK